MNLDSREAERSPAPPAEDAQRVSTAVVWVASLYAIIGGIVTLTGWVIPYPRFTDWAGLGISMFPNPALCGILCGVALILFQPSSESPALRLVGRILSLLACVFGGATLFEHISGINLGIDEILFEGTWGQTAAAAPNRMGVPASVSYLILGAAIAMSSWTRNCRCLASGLAVLPLAIGFLAIVGYWFGASQLFGVARFTGIAWPTATIILFLAVGLVASLPECGFMGMLTRSDAAGILARRLVLPIITIPLLLGWGRVVGGEIGWFDDDFGTALRTLLEIALFLGFLWWSAKSIARHAAAAEEANEALRISEDRFARFMRSLPGLAWIKDLDGRYVFANESAQRAFQRGSDELYGYTDAEFLPAETAAEFMTNDLLALAEPSGLQTIETLRHEDGALHSAIVSKFPIPGRNGRGAFVGGIAIDITDRLRAEEELKEAHRRKDEFLATLAHELRNPLSPIRFSVEICRSHVDPEARSSALDVVDRQIQQMSRLLEDLLDVSRLSYQKLVLRPEVVDLSHVVARAAETSQPLRDEIGQVLHLDLPDTPIFLSADPVRLEQILGNLLHNAAKYGGRGTEVHLTASVHEDEVAISVRDNGVGIPTYRLADIFEMFSQVKSSTGGSEGGLGIGLALVRGLVALHGGRVEARSEGLGMGSEFIVHLPLIPGTMSTPSPADPSETSMRREGGQGLRLLIADDLRDNADSLSSFFRALEYEVRTAYDGERALAEARSFRPDVILLDIGMPVLGGHEVCRRIRDEPWGNDVLIVAITGWGQETDRRLTTDAGFDHHLVKPVEVRELVGIVSARASRQSSP
jgi:PAS domain S-box-containing protein